MKQEYDIDISKKYKCTVAAYMRYSSDNQDKHSIEYQRREIKKYCNKKGYFLNVEYWDEACTGTNDRRQGFQSMISDAHLNPMWTKLLVFDYSRCFRQTYDAYIYTSMLEDLGIDIVSITEPLVKSNEGFLMRDIKHALNAYYSRNVAKFTLAGLMEVASNSKHCGGIAPLGYDIVDKRYVINQEEANAVQLIFDMYEANYSYNRMADELNRIGYRTKTGALFNKNSFSSILHQEKYVGTFIYNKTQGKNSKGRRNSHKYKPENEQVRNPNAIPPIIEQEQFDRVQDMLSERQGGNAQSKSRRYYLLSSLNKLKCAECGANLIGTVRKSHGIEYKYYQCPNHRKHTCSVKDIRSDYLDKFVINALVNDIKSREDLISVFNDSDAKDRIKRLRDKIKGLEKSSRNVLNAIRRESDQDLTDELKRIAEEKRIAKAELDSLMQDQQQATEDDRRDICMHIAKMMMYSESFEVKKYLMFVLDSIVVSNDDIELSLNIA